MTTSTGIDLEQLRTQAKELLKLARAADPESLVRLQSFHPEHQNLLDAGNPRLADCQLVVARDRGFSSWAVLKQYLLFRTAVNAVDTGDIPTLTALVEKHPSLLRYRCRTGDWYDKGYFAGAMLLHHIAGNPIRCPIPANVLAVTRTLLEHGANPNASTEGGATTIGLLLTSKQASEAGVAVTLINLLQDAGAKDALNLDDPKLLDDPLWNVGIETARELVRRGARMALPQAAGLGRLDIIEGIIQRREFTSDLLEVALIYACVQDQEEIVRYLIKQGGRGDIIPAAGQRGGGQATALHNAAWRGSTALVKLLLDNGSQATVRDLEWDGTAADWADHGGHAELAALLRQSSSTRTETKADSRN